MTWHYITTWHFPSFYKSHPTLPWHSQCHINTYMTFPLSHAYFHNIPIVTSILQWHSSQCHIFSYRVTWALVWENDYNVTFWNRVTFEWPLLTNSNPSIPNGSSLITSDLGHPTTHRAHQSNRTALRVPTAPSRRPTTHHHQSYWATRGPWIPSYPDFR